MFDWMGITYYVRGEFYREKAKDYVGAAIATGVSEPGIIFRHILPNALTPVVSFAPFVIVANIGALGRARLPRLWPAGADAELGRADRAGHGKPDEVVAGILSRSACLFVTLLLVVFIGEAVREAFDPKEYLAAPMSTTHPHCCQIRGLRTYFNTEAGVAKAVDGVDLDIHAGRSARPGRRIGIRQERHRAEHAAADPRSARARSSAGSIFLRAAIC